MSESESKFAAGSVIATVVLAAVCVAGGWIGHDLLPKGGAQGPAMMAAPVESVAVRQVEKRAYNLPEQYVAWGESLQDVPLIAEIEGYVKAVKFAEGDIVQKGQLLYELDEERYQATANQCKADLLVAEAENRRAERYFERMQKADERGITQKERDDAEAAAEKTRATIAQAKAALAVADYYLKRTKIVAPIAGQIGKTSVHQGDFVSPTKGAMAKIMQYDPIRVRFPMTDRAFTKIRMALIKGETLQNRLRLILPNGVEYAHTGTWDFDDNEMSGSTATLIMRAKFPNPDRLLLHNQYLTLLVDDLKPELVPCVPQQAVFDIAGGNQGVWVLKDDMTVEQRVVTVREAFEGWAPVMTGLDGSEKVVISGVHKLRPGAKVAIAEATDNDDLNPAYEPPIKE